MTTQKKPEIKEAAVRPQAELPLNLKRPLTTEDIKLLKNDLSLIKAQLNTIIDNFLKEKKLENKAAEVSNKTPTSKGPGR